MANAYNSGDPHAAHIAYRRIVHRKRDHACGRTAVPALISTLLTVHMLLGMLLQTPVASPIAPAYNPDDLVAIKPALREQVAAQLPAGMPEYTIDLTVPDDDPAGGIVLEGRQQVTVTNTTGEVLPELPFRLYANSVTPENPALTITSATIAGSEAPWEMSVSNTVATFPIEGGLAPGERVTIEMTFTVLVPVDDPGHYGIFNHDSAKATTVLAHWYPVLAGRDPAGGWMLEPTSVFGDPIFTNTGMYEVTIAAPEGRTLITSGVEIDRVAENGRQTTTFNAKPSRDFVIVMADNLESVTTEVDGTSITSWALPHHSAGGDSVLEWTANTLRVFNPLLGEYPWLQLQAIEAVVYSAAAVELPQMFIMGSAFYTSWNPGYEMSYFEFTTAHEVVHMWFYSLVGNNQYTDAFIDEGLTNYLSGDVYFRQLYGDEVGDVTHQSFLYEPFRRMIESNADVVVDFPTDSYPSAGSYASAVYTKAPLGFHAIHEAMGDEAFFAGLTDYVAEHSFLVATPADLESALQGRTEIDIRELWAHWFERREGSLDIRGMVEPWNALSALPAA